MAPVASDISLEFLPPEIFIGPGSGCVAAAFMSVPEAAMDEYRCPQGRKHDIRRARQITHVQPESESMLEQE